MIPARREKSEALNQAKFVHHSGFEHLVIPSTFGFRAQNGVSAILQRI
jgi:hypothetical protein